MEHYQRVILLVVCGCLFFWGLGDRDLNASHEARAAQNAQMVLTGGHWLLPRLYDGHLELQKPPLYYWLVALLGTYWWALPSFHPVNVVAPGATVVVK